MIFVGLAYIVALFAYMVYTVINPVSAHEFWTRNINGGWRAPWIDTEAPDYVWTSRVGGVFGSLFLALCIVLTVSSIMHGQR